MKQTPVQWLVEQLPIRIVNSYQSEIVKVLEMEKQQIIDTHLDGQCFSTTIEEIDYAKDYYNEKFKNS